MSQKQMDTLFYSESMAAPVRPFEKMRDAKEHMTTYLSPETVRSHLPWLASMVNGFVQAIGAPMCDKNLGFRVA